MSCHFLLREFPGIRDGFSSPTAFMSTLMRSAVDATHHTALYPSIDSAART
jgi:hypothetical protein